MTTIAVFGGAGLVGSTVAQGFAAAPDVGRLALIDLNADALEVEATDVSTVAERTRRESLTVTRHVVDMRDEAAIAELLSQLDADLVVQAAIPYSWYKISRTLPPETWRKVQVEGRLGPWAPLFLMLPLKLMRARQLAGLTTPVVQISYPDLVNAALANMGLPPTCGAGNSESVNTVMRIIVSERLGVPVRDVSVRMVAHHFHSGFMRSPSPNDDLRAYPMWYRIHVDDRDVTDQFVDDDFVTMLRQRFPHQRPLYAASSAVKNALRILRQDQTMTHVCSPAGLPGGFDARFGPNGPEVVLPTGLAREDAMELVAHCGRGDGVAEIGPKGEIVFTDAAHDALVRHLRYDCATLYPDEVETRAEELVARLGEFAA